MNNAESSGLDYLVQLQVSALMIALIAAGAFISLPIPGSPVPIVLQNMFIVLAGVVLPPRRAVVTVTGYLLLGAAGLPILSGARGGLAHFAGPTGGFLFAYPLSAMLSSALLHRRGSTPSGPEHAGLPRLVGALFLGFGSVYVLGVPWLALTTGMGMPQALVAGMLPFLPGDALKLLALVLLVRTMPDRVWHSLR